MVGICVPDERKTEATLAQEVFKTNKKNRCNMIHMLVHSSAAKAPTDVRTRPKEIRDQDLSDGTGPVDVGNQNKAVISVQR